MSNLPFLKRRQSSGIAGPLTEYRKPDEDGEGHKDQEDQPEDGLKVCAKDLIACVSSGDEQGVAKALRAAFEILDSEPHVEGEHIEDKEERD